MFFKSIGNSVRESMAKRKLEGELATVISLVEGHKAAGLPSGHRFYGLLEQRAVRAMNSLHTTQKKIGVQPTPFDDIEAGVPMMRELHNLSNGKGDEDKVGVAVGRFMALGLFAGVIVTISVAVYHNLYVVLTHWVNTHYVLGH